MHEHILTCKTGRSNNISIHVLVATCITVKLELAVFLAAGCSTMCSLHSNSVAGSLRQLAWVIAQLGVLHLEL